MYVQKSGKANTKENKLLIKLLALSSFFVSLSVRDQKICYKNIIYKQLLKKSGIKVNWGPLSYNGKKNVRF